MMSMLLPIASAAVKPNRRSAALFQPVMVPSSNLVMMASLDDSTTALNRPSRSVRRCRSEAASRRDRSEQASQLGLQADIVDQQDGEHEARGAKAVDAAEIEADIESRHVQDRRQGDVEQPGAHHHHQPDVEDRMRPAKPQRRQCSEAEAPYRRYHAEHDGRVVTAAQQYRQTVVLRGDDPGERGHRDADRNDARNDRRAGRALYLWLVVPCLSASA